jgi:F-type H+-transporting ATPase subunit epsilon
MAVDPSSLLLEVVTPQGIALKERVEEVVAPSADGEFGVLPGHLPMLAVLSIGLLHYRIRGKLTDVGVGSGFAEVLRDRTLVITDRFITKDDVDVLAVRSRLKKVDAELEKWSGELDDPKRLELIDEEQWLATQLELIGDPPQSRVLAVTQLVDYSQVIPTVDEAPSEEGSGRE